MSNAFGVHGRMLAFALFFVVALPSIACAAEAAPVAVHGNADAPMTGHVRRMPDAEPPLVPIADTLRTVRLDALAAVPVQHGGRYKPLHTLAMEAADGIGGKPVLGPGHTPLSGLLDLLFCHAGYRNQPIVKVKHAELAQDLAVVLPPAEQDLLKREHRITPERLQDPAVQAELERLGRLTAKSKAISQVRTAAFWADRQELLAACRLYPLPAGAHEDHWRAPSEVAPPFAGALKDFLVRAVAAQGAMAGFTLNGSAALPLDDQLARQLRLSADDQRRVNMEVLWPLWKAAGGGRFKAEVADALADDPAQTRALTGCDEAVAAGLVQLKERWAEVGLAAEDCADPARKPVIDATLARATAAWAGLAHGWSQVRHGHPAPELQGHIDALVAATQELRGHLDHDRAVRGWKPLHIDTGLELTYWHWKGFSGVAWLFLFAVPLLALGSLGRIRWALWLGLGLFAVGFAGQAAAFLIRWQLAERIPLANLYESMAAAATLASLVALPIEAVLAWRILRGRPWRVRWPSRRCSSAASSPCPSPSSNATRSTPSSVRPCPSFPISGCASMSPAWWLVMASSASAA